MNYSVEAKRQLCDVPTEGYELPLLSAIVHTCALLSRDSSGLKIKLISANRYLGGTVEKSVKKIAPEISVEKRGRETVFVSCPLFGFTGYIPPWGGKDKSEADGSHCR